MLRLLSELPDTFGQVRKRLNELARTLVPTGGHDELCRQRADTATWGAICNADDRRWKEQHFDDA